jgi:hypothetical protein
VELTGIRTMEAPAPGYVRLVGDVRYDRGAPASESFWYEVPEELGGALSRSGNPWLACLLPVAAAIGEPLRLRVPVDSLLLRGASEILAIWAAWYPRLRCVPVEADGGAPAAGGTGSAAFFTGGVDSFFTALRNAPGQDTATPVQELLTIAGLDIPLQREQAAGRRRERLRAAASRLGLGLAEIATNAKETRLREADWHDVAHGPVIVSAGLALEGRYRRLLIASTKPYGALQPLGSHPMTDPLLSTQGTRVVHDGAAFGRGAKIAFISRFDVAMEALHVCYRGKDDANCGECEKCLRTLLWLELSGRREACRTFAPGPLDLRRVEKIFVIGSLVPYYRELRGAAARAGRRDLVRAVDRSTRRSTLRRRMVGLSERLRDRRLLWRAARPLRRAALAGAVL